MKTAGRQKRRRLFLRDWQPFFPPEEHVDRVAEKPLHAGAFLQGNFRELEVTAGSSCRRPALCRRCPARRLGDAYVFRLVLGDAHHVRGLRAGR